MISPKIAVVIFVVAMLLSPARGQGPGQRGNMPPGENVMGTVSSIGTDSLTVAPAAGGDPITVKVSDSTRVMKERQPVRLADIKVGDTVFARGNFKEKQLEAFVVGVVPPEMAERMKQGGGRGMFLSGPGQGAFKPEDLGTKVIFGEVKSINETRLTIARPDGQTQEIEVDENTSFKRGNESITLPEIKVGDFVRGPGELKNNIFTAKELRVGRMGMVRGLGGPRDSSNPAPPPDKNQSPAPPPN